MFIIDNVLEEMILFSNGRSGSILLISIALSTFNLPNPKTREYLIPAAFFFHDEWLASLIVDDSASKSCMFRHLIKG